MTGLVKLAGFLGSRWKSTPSIKPLLMAYSRRGQKSHAWNGARGSRPLRVLVDMDCVLCDFEGDALRRFKEKFPEEPHIPLDERNTFYMRDQYGELRGDLGEKISSILYTPGFFRNLRPIDGAIDAMKEMSGVDNVEVFLCTSPVRDALSSVSEKYEWVQNHMGKDWVSRVIIASDKTMVQGDILIDDRPTITGSIYPPGWDHVLYTACHNRHMDIGTLRCAHRLDGWTDSSLWKKLIDQYKRKVRAS